MGNTVIINGKKTSLANKAMLQFAKYYAELHWYLEGWKKPDDFWGNLVDERMHPEAPKVVGISYVLPMFDEDKEDISYWKIPRVEIDSYFGHPRLSVVDREANFCCMSYDRETSSFKEMQAWGEDGLGLATFVKVSLERIIIRLEGEYGTGQV